jgi:phosphoglycerate dehydrogenase-like enzyme
MKPRVLVDPGPWVEEADRRRLCDVVDWVDPAPAAVPGAVPAEDDLIRQLEGCAGLIRMGGRIPALSARVLAASPDLRLVGIRGDRFGWGVDLAAAAAGGVRVVDTDNQASSQPVAEWVLALVLACLRNAGVVFRHMLAGSETWAQAHNEHLVCGELTGRRVGLVGCGLVGQRLVELLAPFRVDLLVCDPYLDPQIAQRLGLRLAGLPEVLTHAEVLIVQTPLTPRTRGMIGRAELALLRSGAVLVNCSRGPVLDQAALIERLQRGDLIAGLDVFDPEPLPGDSPLRSLPNAILTPHIAWYAPNAFGRYFGSMVDEFVRYFTDQPLQHELTPRLADIRHGRI